MLTILKWTPTPGHIVNGERIKEIQRVLVNFLQGGNLDF